MFTYARRTWCVNGENRARAYGRYTDASIVSLSFRWKWIGKRVVAGGNVKKASYVV